MLPKSLRRSALAGILVAALAALTFTGTAAANATDVAISWGDIVHDLNVQDSSIQLAAGTGTISVDQGNAFLKTFGDVTIDLNGNHLLTQGIILSEGASLTITDSSAGETGLLTANGSPQGRPGIVDAGGSSVDIEAGEVDATGSYNMPAIGSGNGVCDPIDFSECRAQTGIGSITVNGGLVKAIAGGNAAALGGGNGQPGTSVTIGGNGTVNATAGAGQSVIGAGAEGGSFGSLSISGVLGLASGETLNVPSGASASTTSTGSITGAGEVDVEGSFQNDGAIAVPAVLGGANVTGHNFAVTFDPSTNFETGAIPTSPQIVPLYATSFQTGNRTAPTNLTGPGDYVNGWTDTSNAVFSPTYVFTADTTLYAHWAELDSISIASEVSSAPSGAEVAQTVTGHGPSGYTNDQTAFATFHSTVASDAFNGNELTLGTPGARSITATVTSVSNSGATLTTATPASVIATGPLASGMTITPNKPTVTAGVATVFTVSGKDSAGNSLGNISDQVTWSGLQSTDHRTGNSITFAKPGTRTVKATIGTHSITATVKVVVGPLASLVFVKPPTTSVAGTSKTLAVNGYDIAGNSLGSATKHTVFSINDAQSGETVSGAKVVLTQAGARTVTATDGTVVGTTPITVTGAAPVQLQFTQFPGYNIYAPTVFVFAATGVDTYGNDLGDISAHLVMHSSDARDKIVGNTVTFTRDGYHYLYGTDGAATTGPPNSDWTYVHPVQPESSGTIPGKLTFDNLALSAYVSQGFQVQAFTSDVYGNAEDTITAVTYSVSGSGNTITPAPDGSYATVTIPTLGHHTVTATRAGYGPISEVFNVIKDTSTPTFPTSSITASIPSTITVSVPHGGSPTDASGTVTLHYGSKSATLPLTPGNPSTATFSLPALAVGNYSFYATYGGSTFYNGKTSPKYVVHVVPGALDHLVFVKPVTTTVAGVTDTFNVNGYDINNNLIGSETSAATFDLSDLNTSDGEVVAANRVTPTVVGSRTVTATVGSVTKETSITVTHAAAATLTLIGNPSTATAGDTFTITATARDAYDNPLGDVSSALTITSTVPSDKAVKNKVTVTKAGFRYLTVKDGLAHGTLDFTVTPAAAVTGKYVFENISTTATIDTQFAIDVFTADKYANPIDEATVTSWNVVTAGTNPITTTFTTVGKHTVTATIGTVHVSKVVTVVKANVDSISFPTEDLVAGLPDYLQVSVASGLANPTGTVTLHFGSKKYTGTLVAGSPSTYNFNLGAPVVGNYTVYAVYGGSSTFNPITSTKLVVSVDATS